MQSFLCEAEYAALHCDRLAAQYNRLLAHPQVHFQFPSLSCLSNHTPNCANNCPLSTGFDA